MEDQRELIFTALGNEFDEEEKLEEVHLDDDDTGLVEALSGLKAEADHISPEDLAWVDSCLVADPESSVDSWADLKEALLDGIFAFAASREDNGYGLDEAKAENAEKMLVDKEEVEEQPEIANSGGNTAGDRVTRGVSGEQSAGIQEEIETRDSIFRVWDLRIGEEEDDNEIISQLKRAVEHLNVVEEGVGFITEPKTAVATSAPMDGKRLPNPEASIASEILDDLVSGLEVLTL